MSKIKKIYSIEEADFDILEKISKEERRSRSSTISAAIIFYGKQKGYIQDD